MVAGGTNECWGTAASLGPPARRSPPAELRGRGRLVGPISMLPWRTRPKEQRRHRWKGESANCENSLCPTFFFQRFARGCAMAAPPFHTNLEEQRRQVCASPPRRARRPPPTLRASPPSPFDCPRARPFSSPPSPPSLPAPAPPADRRSPRHPVRAAPEPPGPARRGSVRHRALRRDCRSMGAAEVRSRRPCLAHSWRARARGRRRPFPPPYPADVCGDSPVLPPARPYPSSAHAASPTTTCPTSGRGRPAPSSPPHRRPQRRPRRHRTEALARAAAQLLRAGRGRRTVCGAAAAPPRRLR
jgi:hypothetical protein